MEQLPVLNTILSREARPVAIDGVGRLGSAGVIDLTSLPPSGTAALLATLAFTASFGPRGTHGWNVITASAERPK